jgi:hypothetical protein
MIRLRITPPACSKVPPLIGWSPGVGSERFALDQLIQFG